MGITIIIGTFLLTIIIGMPIALGLGVASLAYLLFYSSVPMDIIPQIMANGLDSYNIIAIPFFILAAQIMNNGGVTERLLSFAQDLVGRFKGGLAYVNILTSMLFAGMSGSAVADSAGLGKVLIPKMNKEGFHPRFSSAVTAASSTIGPIIPPSVPMVVYGILAEVSISQLFIAGAIPGLIMGVSMMVLCWIYAKKYDYSRAEKASIGQIARSGMRAVPALLTPIIILGGMWAGIFSPTEAAAVAVGYAIIQGMAVRELKWKEFWDALAESAIYAATIMLIVSMANVFGWVISTEQIPNKLTSFILSITENKYVILFMINIFLLIAGAVMEILSVMLITIPVLLPLVLQVGIDPVHLGVVVVLNLMIGLLSPPFGLSLYIAQDIAGITYAEAVKGILPFIILILAILALITYWPQVVLYLPGIVG